MGERARIVKRRWPEWLFLLTFIALTGGAVAVSLRFPAATQAANVALSIGTSGIVAFVFYYVVSDRLEAQRRTLVRDGALRSYRNAKRDIAMAIIHASQKGGRRDLVADGATIERVLSPSGFKELFDGGREGDEGFYAFANQMSDQTTEYDEIVFNLKIIGRAIDRLIDSNLLEDAATYDLFVRLDAMLRRIERNGPGYDESKLLCSFVRQTFSGWSFIDGNLGYDPIERAIEKA